MKIVEGDLESEQVIELLREHLDGMHASSPPGSVFALDLSELKTPDIRFFSVWDGRSLMGIGALKELDARNAEIKSMRTSNEHLRKGVAAVLLEHIIAEARHRGYERLSLETGSGDAFEPALALYRRFGFAVGDAFDQYEETQFSQFLHLQL